MPKRRTFVDWLPSDLRYAIHGLRRSPGLAVTIVVTLALGVGANAAMLSVLDRVFFQAPAGVKDPATVRRLYTNSRHWSLPANISGGFSIPDLNDLRAVSRGAAELAAYGGEYYTPL